MDLTPEQVVTEAMENGTMCLICHGELNEEYGRPMACEGCGGDGVLLVDGDDV